MDIQKFQQKLTEVCELGEKNGKVLKPEQIKECFGELDLDKSQLIKILQYLKLKGISIEGAEEISAASQTGPEEVSEEKEEKVPLTAEEEAYLKEYLEGLEEQEQGERSAEELFELLSKGDALAQAELSQKYLRAAAEMAVEMNCEEIFIADLIQEANISLLMALGEEEPGFDPVTGEMVIYRPWGNFTIFYGDFRHSDERVLLGKVASGLEILAGQTDDFTGTMELMGAE